MQTQRIHRFLAAATACLIVLPVFAPAFAPAAAASGADIGANPGVDAKANADTTASANRGTTLDPRHDPPVAKYMWRRYHNKSKNCPTYSKASADYNANAADYPAVDCTGILMRFTSPSKETRGGWIPEDKSLPGAQPSGGGVSFIYIRTDIISLSAPWGDPNGFTLYPPQGKYAAPAGKQPATVLCAYPRDAASDYRADAGCAPSCKMGEANDIRNAVQWLQSWKSAGNGGQCSFDLRDTATRGANFRAFLMGFSPTVLTQNAGQQWNELRVKTWGTDADSAKALALESFFYMNGSPAGRANAQFDQQKYYEATQLFVPIVEITTPTAVGQDFNFAYHSADQKVPVPTFDPPLPCTPGDFDPANLKC